jgi:acetylglutamate/LysW-gamma-L-alpha-aminoadipate kinase
VTVVVKIGGARAVEPGGALADVAHLTANGEDVVVVHGGSTAIDDTLADLGREPEYVETPDGVAGRFTDAETMDAVTMAMATVNTDLTAALVETGVPAVGLSGVDGDLLSGPRKSAVKVVEDGKKKIKRGDHAGRIESVDADLLATLLDAGYTPVVSVPMLAVEEADDGDPAVRAPARPVERPPVNADAHRAAPAGAGALVAHHAPEDPATVVETVATPADLDRVEAAAEGFMTRKVMAAVEALEGGAGAVTVADATVNDPLLGALAGRGTRFEPGAVGRTDGSAGDGDDPLVDCEGVAEP